MKLKEILEKIINEGGALLKANREELRQANKKQKVTGSFGTQRFTQNDIKAENKKFSEFKRTIDKEKREEGLPKATPSNQYNRFLAQTKYPKKQKESPSEEYSDGKNYVGETVEVEKHTAPGHKPITVRGKVLTVNKDKDSMRIKTENGVQLIALTSIKSIKIN